MRAFYSSTVDTKDIQDLLKQIETCKSVSDVRVLKTKLLFVNGLVNQVSRAQVLEKLEFMGQYGNIVKIDVNKVKQNFFSAFVEYQTEAEAALALLSLDDFVYKGKVIKVFYGSTKYCFSFLKGEQCRIRQCAFSHNYQKKYTYFKSNTSSINHSKIAEQILIKHLHTLHIYNIPSTTFPTTIKTIETIKSLIEAETSDNKKQTAAVFPEIEWDDLQQQIKSFLQSEGQKQAKKKTKVQEFLEYAEQKLHSLIFKNTILDEDN